MNEPVRAEFHDYVVDASTRLLRVAYLLTGNMSDAEDLLQTALVKTYLAWPRIRERVAVDAYVRRVMLNTRTSWWRRSRHIPVTPLGRETEPTEPPVRDAYADADVHTTLWLAVSRLPRMQRAVVVLRYYEDLSEAETADALGIAVGTVKSTASRALCKLRVSDQLLEQERLVPLARQLEGSR